MSETWLQDDVGNSELFPPDYNVHRCDRKLDRTNLTTGGGVLLACKSVLKSEKLDLSHLETNFPSLDIIGCKCTINVKVIFIVVIYIPPTTSLQCYEQFFEALELLDLLYNQNILILGDFNNPNYCNNDNNTKTICLNNFSSFFNLNQLNNITNVNGRMLDLVFSNLKCEVMRNNIPFVTEDAYHPALFISIEKVSKLHNFHPNLTQKAYNFRKANYATLYDAFLHVDWSFVNNFSDVNIALEAVYSKLYEILDAHVPLYKKVNKKYPKWYTLEIISNIKRKYKHYKKFKETKDNFYLEQFKHLRSVIKNQIKAAYDSYLLEVQSSLIVDPQNFWSYIQ